VVAAAAGIVTVGDIASPDALLKFMVSDPLAASDWRSPFHFSRSGNRAMRAVAVSSFNAGRPHRPLGFVRGGVSNDRKEGEPWSTVAA
jgi:hypothetical protein